MVTRVPQWRRTPRAAGYLLIHGDPGLFDRLNLTGVRLVKLHQARPGRRDRLPRGERCVLSDQPGRGSAGRQWPGSRCLAGSGACLILLLAAMTGDLWRVRRARRSLTGSSSVLLARRRAGCANALVERLADPNLVIAYPIEDGHRYVDAEAREVRLPPPPGERAVTSLWRGPLGGRNPGAPAGRSRLSSAGRQSHRLGSARPGERAPDRGRPGPAGRPSLLLSPHRCGRRCRTAPD